MSSHNPFFAAAERAADNLASKARELDKAKVPNWTKEFAPMGGVRRRLERASTNEQRAAIRQEIQKMPDGEVKMRQLLSFYKGRK